MAIDLVARAVVLGLRALADEIEAGRIDAAAVLDHVGPPALAPAAPPAVPSPKHPRAKRRARRSRPAAPPTEEPAAAAPGPSEPSEPSEAARLVAQLEARHGGLSAAAARFGLSRTSLINWRAGKPISPGALERLRQAAETRPFARVAAAQDQE